MKHFGTAVSNAENKRIRGADAFILHDRYGFPVDLTLLMAEKQGLGVDMEVRSSRNISSETGVVVSLCAHVHFFRTKTRTCASTCLRKGE